MERKISDHWNGKHFFNPGVSPQRFSQVLKWMTHRQRGPWREFVDEPPGPKPPVRVQGGDLRITFINHATVLIQTEGRNLLTDPVWSERVSPVQFLGPKRHRNPGIRFEDLPPIDCILISHNHYDHLDAPTLRRILERDRAEIFCPLGVAGLLRNIGFKRIHEKDWWETSTFWELQIHCTPAQHFSARTPFDRNRSLWCGWLIEGRDGHIFYAGDSGFGNHFVRIRNRFSNIRLALLPIGAYDPVWFMGSMHMTPEQSLQVFSILEARAAVAIHFGTLSLADDSENEPVRRLRHALKEGEAFWVLAEGEGRDFPRVSLPEIA